MKLVPISLLALSTSAFASTLPIPLNALDYFDQTNSTGTWNFLEGHITGAIAPSGAHANRLSFGDGSDGAFNDGASTSGVTGSGTTSISISSTASKSVYNFASFNLSSGKTLTVTGDRPITIRVHGTTTIAGTIAANGGNGQVTGGTTQTVGGTAGPGGGAGGNGAAPADASGLNGIIAPSGSGGNPTRPGFGGLSAAGGTEFGGGGGCNGAGPDSFDATDAANNGGPGDGTAGVCPLSRTDIAYNFDAAPVFTGGAGGGGGGAFSATFSGASGGGGGGAIRIVSLGAITLSGNIEAKGGAGGANGTPGNCGGAAGGGAGGSIWIQSASTMAGAGKIWVTGGSGGIAPAGVCAGLDGGNGSRGVYRADTAAAAYAGPAQDPANVATGIQVKPPASQTYVVYSTAIDFSERYISFSAPTESFGCGTQTTDGTTTVTYEGSHDSVTWEKSVSAAHIQELNDYPYVRFKVTVATNASSATPPCLTGLTFNYELKDLPELTLKGGLFCGRINTWSARTGTHTRSQRPGALFTDLALLALAIALTRRRALHGVRWRIVSQ